MKISFNITDELAEEAERILGLTELDSVPQLFEKAFTLLRIHVDAHQKGHTIKEVSPEGTDVIVWPFVTK